LKKQHSTNLVTTIINASSSSSVTESIDQDDDDDESVYSLLFFKCSSSPNVAISLGRFDDNLPVDNVRPCQAT
jgi:hypothetical protein